MADGRYQRGDAVPLGVATTAGEGVPTSPDAAPLATIAGPDGGVVATVRLPMAGDDTHFGAAWVPGVDVALGNYSVTYTYQVAGVPGESTAAFEVIPGGDPGGAVVAMASVERPLARYIVAQLASGRLVQGTNPRL
jgi:hypothetical protein